MKRHKCPKSCNIKDDKQSHLVSLPQKNIYTPSRTLSSVKGDFDLHVITGQLSKEEMEKLRAKRNLEETTKSWKNDGGQTVSRGYAAMVDAMKKKENNN